MVIIPIVLQSKLQIVGIDMGDVFIAAGVATIVEDAATITAGAEMIMYGWSY